MQEQHEDMQQYLQRMGQVLAQMQNEHQQVRVRVLRCFCCSPLRLTPFSARAAPPCISLRI